MTVKKTHYVGEVVKNGYHTYIRIVKVEECIRPMIDGPVNMVGTGSDRIYIKTHEGKETSYIEITEEEFEELQKNPLK